MEIKEIISKLIGDKKEYRNMMARVKVLPQDYQYVFDKIQKYMWSYCAGDGMDMMQIQYELIELFETGAANNKPVLDITGEDVAAFCDELLKNARTYTENWRESLNSDIKKSWETERGQNEKHRDYR